jgi:hypothetical protein
MEKSLGKGPIENVAWGVFIILGKTHTKRSDGAIIGCGKDIVLIGERLLPWKERKGHRLRSAMLEPIKDADIDILIIGNGFCGALEVPSTISEELRREKGVEVIVAKTPDACRLYNNLYSQKRKVALLAHGTC